MTLPRDPSVEALAGIELPSFSIEDYLEQRNAKADLVMVEFGHGGIPVAYQQPEGFTGQRAYISLEAWLRHSEESAHNIRTKLADKAFGQNIFFMTIPTGGQINLVEIEGRERPERQYSGEFRSRSELPKRVAHEVFASNVLCDPHIAFNPDRTVTLLSEMARLLDRDGTLVLRESDTPLFVRCITPDVLDLLGLELRGLERKDDSPSWDLLEDHYNGNTSPLLPPRDSLTKPDSFYLFLGKKPTRSKPTSY